MAKIDLSGRWDFCLDNDKLGIDKKYYLIKFADSIKLPTTVSEAKKGTPSDSENSGFLTDPYLFEGFTWYSREVEFKATEGKELFLILERTRTSHIWVDDSYIGSDNSLSTSHRYHLTPYIQKEKHRLTILVDNTSCPVKGGHMTSQDTQTNWNGITGGIYIEIFQQVYLTGVKIYSDAVNKQIKVKASLIGAKEYIVKLSVVDSENNKYAELEQHLLEGDNTFLCKLDKTAHLWSEHSPYLYTLNMELSTEIYRYSFGLRDFQAVGTYFEINGNRTFLRGKHDGLIFPLTGYAPTDLKSWLEVMATAKRYGINHYRFHTCCPPEAAFIAADILGIYMEPELPFWGTVTKEGDQGHDEKGQQYLIKEGFRILDEFGNHPSFVMMSLGNELWGSKSRLNEILGKYKVYDERHLYTQGSNNFQFTPCILENEDFYCGVRFSRDRLFRGSYAMCDAPQGHLQTLPPDMIHNYNEFIRPNIAETDSVTEGEIMIQYETGVKTVKAEAATELIPQIPVVSHEIGQYAMYPDFSEISRYTGVLKARNLEVFQNRLQEEGMLDFADKFFKASGRFAAECYKAEIETALRSSELAGFQLLDLQDFTGQGTALVGILNAFMENKGVISEEEWREFCSETVVLAELPKLVFECGEKLSLGIILATFALRPIYTPKLRLSIVEDKMTEVYTTEVNTTEVNITEVNTTKGNPIEVNSTKKERIFFSTELTLDKNYSYGVYKLSNLALEMPITVNPTNLKRIISIVGTDIHNHYDLWLYPKQDQSKGLQSKENVVITDNIVEAVEELEKGRRVLLFPNQLTETNSIEGTYCTDFWCYPMFRSISESMNRAVPIGTHGLLIDEKHPIFEEFPTQHHSTPQWYDIISNSRSMILDGTNIEPIVWTIDNFERNHRLGLIFELKYAKGKLLICTSDLRKQEESLPATYLLQSILKYMKSNTFAPTTVMDQEQLKTVLFLQ